MAKSGHSFSCWSPIPWRHMQLKAGWMAWNSTSVINATKQFSKKKEITLLFVQPRMSFVSYILVANIWTVSNCNGPLNEKFRKSREPVCLETTIIFQCSMQTATVYADTITPAAIPLSPSSKEANPGVLVINKSFVWGRVKTQNLHISKIEQHNIQFSLKSRTLFRLTCCNEL